MKKTLYFKREKDIIRMGLQVKSISSINAMQIRVYLFGLVKNRFVRLPKST